MTFVDTSVWVNYFNGLSNRETEILDEILSSDIVIIGDLILLELLQGFRNEKEFSQALMLMDSLEKPTLLNIDNAIEYAEINVV